MRPNFSTAASMTRLQSANFSRSAVRLRTSTFPDSSLATSWTSSERSTSTRVPFSLAIFSATRLPMPCAAPVMTATFFLKRFAIVAPDGVGRAQTLAANFS